MGCLKDWMEENELREEALTTMPFTLDRIPGYEDGLFPPSPLTEMLGELPEEIFEEFGEVIDGLGGVPRLEIREGEVPSLLATLEGLGSEVERDDDLIASCW